MDKKAFGKRLQQYRIRSGYSQEVFSEKIEKSTIFVSYMERGERLPSLDTLIRIADVLEIPLDLLVANESKYGSAMELADVERRMEGLSAGEKEKLLELIDGLVEIELKYRNREEQK